MTLDIFKRDLLHVVFGAGAAVAICVLVVPKFHGPVHVPCHDEVYIMPPYTDDDPGDSAGGLPARRIKFACPHPKQSMTLLGQGGIKCACLGVRDD